MIEPAALYSFNKSHAAAYSFISYQTAWLKTHFPVEFGAALLRSAENNTDDLAKFINENKSN
jgi:DNA polymerase-3 subunit alpha